jgi:hypothetical protein
MNSVNNTFQHYFISKEIFAILCKFSSVALNNNGGHLYLMHVAYVEYILDFSEMGRS